MFDDYSLPGPSDSLMGSGRDLEPSLAKPIALGEVDPVTLLDIVDTNPSFMPHALRTLPLQLNDISRSRPEITKAKGKAKADCSNGTLLSFFCKSFLLSTVR